LQRFNHLCATMIMVLLAAVLPLSAQTPLANQLFGRESAPFTGPALAIGSYARGCASGLEELPQTGPTWQAMRLSRNRNFGHPDLVAFLKVLSQTAHDFGWAGLYIGDMAQPRGGPMTSGHASHQIGLDADIWMLAPKSMTLSRDEREKISSVSVRSDNQRTVTDYWSLTHHAIMRAAALDERVDRIFVAAAVKVEMCKTATQADRLWMQKIRPWSGHNAHFHVRLKCPRGGASCQTQTPSVDMLSKGGDGCDDSLTYWVTDYLQPKKSTPTAPSTTTRPKKSREFTLDDLPKQCALLVSR